MMVVGKLKLQKINDGLPMAIISIILGFCLIGLLVSIYGPSIFFPWEIRNSNPIDVEFSLVDYVLVGFMLSICFIFFVDVLHSVYKSWKKKGD